MRHVVFSKVQELEKSIFPPDEVQGSSGFEPSTILGELQLFDILVDANVVSRMRS